MSLKTVEVNCNIARIAEHSLCIRDSVGTIAHIPFQFVIRRSFHPESNEVCCITIPEWIAIDRGLSYE